MSSPTIKSSQTNHDIVRRNGYSSSCFPCDGGSISATSSTGRSAMQLDTPFRSQSQDEQKCDATMTEDSTASALMPQQQQQQQQASQTSVGELVVKAKKAAVSLWMILHAQNCRHTEDSCPHRGCAETKLLLVHVKSCAAGPGFPCPVQHKGCNETRKLLAHYRRCKDMRMKQVGLGRRSGLQPDQSCLVCSLMARHAKSMMDRTKNGSQGKNQCQVTSLLSNSPIDPKFNVEKELASFPQQRSPSMTLMPPPPPRSRSILASATILTNFANSSFENPPSPSPKAATVAAVADPYSPATSDPSLLSKSVDSSVKVPFPILRHTSRKVEAADDELVVPGHAAARLRRQRAESYDERKNRVKFAPSLISNQYYFDEKQGEEEQLSTPPRRRSASVGCQDGNTTQHSSPGCCDTIAEEGLEQQEEPIFPID